VGSPIIRVLSDVHYADKSSRVRNLEQLRPLFAGATSLVFNGDTLDTRPSDHPGETEKARREIQEFLQSAGIPFTLLTGNHDPDLSAVDSLEFADGQVLVTHGDVLFDNIVPWSKHAHMIRTKVIAALAALPEGESSQFEGRLKAFRVVSASLPQTHQMEKNPFKHAIRLAGDTVWPPHRFFSMVSAWNEAPERAATLARRHRPKARFVMIGHTHRPGVWKTPSGVVVINTGSFCKPFGAMSVDITPDKVRVNRLVTKKGAFHQGAVVAEFPLS
jgi:predicted phosphodiesterase